MEYASKKSPPCIRVMVSPTGDITEDKEQSVKTGVITYLGKNLPLLMKCTSSINFNFVMSTVMY